MRLWTGIWLALLAIALMYLVIKPHAKRWFATAEDRRKILRRGFEMKLNTGETRVLQERQKNDVGRIGD